MTIALNNANAGTAHLDGPNATSIPVTTSATIASGALVVVGFGFDLSSATVTSIAGGTGLSWHITNKGSSVAGFDGCALAWTLAPSGIASSTTLTATLSATCFGRCAGVMSFTGVDTTTTTDGAAVTNQDAGATTAWTSGNVTASAGSLTCTVCWTEAGTSSTATAGTEALEANTGNGDGGIVMHYRIDAGGGTVTNAGTWNSNVRWVTASQAFLAAAGGGGGGGPAPELVMAPRDPDLLKARL